MTNPRTLAAYEAGVDDYVAALAPGLPAAFAQNRDAFTAALPPGGQILELGSGPGLDAAWFEQAGFAVRRTDATESFVRRLRELGHPADLLNVLTDDFGGPYDGVWAAAVLLHLTRPELTDVLIRLRSALRPTGVFSFSVKEGDGERWVTDKLAAPRYFVYWRSEALTDLVTRAGWQVVEVSRFAGRADDWLQLRCRP